jgi:arylsulfatase A-like enzyme
MKSFRAAMVNLEIWIIGFGIWFFGEVALRVLIYHHDWAAPQIVSYAWMNTLFGLCCGLLFGLMHTLFLALFTKQKIVQRWASARILMPTALLACGILIPFRTFALYQTRLSLFQRWVIALLFLLMIYVACAVVTRLMSNVVNRPAFPKAPAILGLTIIPLFILATVFLLQRNGSTATVQGPVRYVVLISIDTTRYDYIGAYGVHSVRTPVIDHLASEGVLFRQAISSIPLTGPSHITMLTGQPPLVHGVRFNGQPLPRKTPTITKVLRSAGFETAAFVSGYPLKTTAAAIDGGFQEFDDYLAYTDHISETFLGRLLEFVPFLPQGLLRVGHEVTDRAVAWLQKRDGSPFFLFLHYYDPHFPYGTKKDLRGSNDILKMTATPADLELETRRYQSEVETVDYEIGRVIEVLKKKNLYDRTLLIVTSDHGESLGEHNLYYTHDNSVYDQLLRVPLIIRCPALLKSPISIDQQVGLLDIAKTVLDSVGLDKKMKTSGVDLIHLAQKIPSDYQRSIVSHNFVREVHSLRTGNWKLIQTGEPESFELYDLVRDPLESKNVLKNEHSLAVDLKSKLGGILHSPGSANSTWTTDELSAEQIEKLKSLGYVN